MRMEQLVDKRKEHTGDRMYYLQTARYCCFVMKTE